MSAEYRAFVQIPAAVRDHHDRLLADAQAAWARYEKARPGDRSDLIRFEATWAQIETQAARARATGSPAVVRAETAGPAPKEAEEWIRAGERVVEVRFPLMPGPTPVNPSDPSGPVSPAKRWESIDARGKAAVAERFRAGLRDVIEGRRDAAIRPSGVANSVLTKGLREFASSAPSHAGPPVQAPVVYRDGSTAAPFPLRSLPLRDEVPSGLRLVRCALMSVRHPEMDCDVDAAWFRNTQVSRPRPAAQTDALCHELTREGLDTLTAGEPVELRLYQTGLDSAIVGFYRAVVEHLRDRPGSVFVLPLFFSQGREDQPATFAPGRPWGT